MEQITEKHYFSKFKGADPLGLTQGELLLVDF
jgi:hypothetical protein